MHPAILPAALTFAAAAAIACYVGTRREKSDLHWLLLALLGSMLVWTLGTICRFSVSSDAGLAASLRLIFLGVATAPPLWLLLAARYARFRPMLERRESIVALLVPSALFYLALLTNEGHRLVMRDVNFEVLRAGAPAWAGPVFWAFIGWTYVCIAGGLVLYLGTARRMVANAERRRAVLLAAASAMPVLMSLVYLFRLLPMEFDLTPTGLVFALAVLSITIFRYQLLESLPLARRDVIERLDDGVIMANSAGVILDLNPAAAAILRSSAESLRGQWLAEALRRFVRKEDAAPVAAAIEALSRSGETWVSELRTPDERWIEIRGACGSSADGEPSGLFALLRDRTEERRGERFVRQTQKLETVGTLVSGIAHEINNPLAFIRANLSEIHRMGEQVERYLDDPDAKLARELKDLAQIAHETLDGIGRIERIVAGMRRLSPSRRDAVGPVELNEVVEDAVRLANLRRDAGVELSTTLAPRLPLIEGSPQRLVQALLNLLVNARQALQGQPAARIAVETCCEGANVVVRVCDNGPGIPEAIQERIFDPFFTTKDPDQGTGLGLSIAFDILRDHGGVLEVGCSGAAGTEFAARIPARRP